MRGIILLLLSLALLRAQPLAAQEAYTKLAFGIGMPQPPGNTVYVDPFPSATIGPLPTAIPYEISNASLFTGAIVHFREGYRFKNGIGAELGLIAGINTKKLAYQMMNSLHSEVTIYSPTPIMLSPALSYRMNERRGSVFGSVGACIPLKKKIFTETRTADDKGEIFDKTELLTKFSIGIVLTAGYQIPVSKTISFFGEASFMEISFLTKQMNLKESIYRGEDFMPYRTASQRQVNYSNGYVYLGSGNPDKPTTLPPYRTPFGHFGGNIGLIIHY